MENSNENGIVRVNIKISKKIKEFFENKSAETGISQSALMAMALQEYMEQKKAIEFSNDLDKYIQMLKK
ncbi:MULTISPECIES: ribbon-helix-helix domain-containing protein [Bacillota]|uniref:Ribbon-helix-helix protein CopG domain-containing protein n=1 Tax=Clostridium perfringens TaxID=1502 RepID=A0AB37C036_CLOPF|nr:MULTISPECIES: ribbon-helix-helix domain-containing protein [Bacillota]MBI5996042.1 CopG family transcriptional regulator [Clostridium perfringens]MBW8009610.1 CopG family transcriptional regulator [Lactobacillus helveticus]MDC4246219.1 ribbon-helix-helix domain-containing protein [Clostridium perfringens]MDK0648751.1 ribbon-helix-helix domain-containing protein [Clostridium perfringens]MDK0954779.1 ribbon-helix-helix domain-containing protein [Clostridium perfringens]